MIIAGWPNDIKDTPKALQLYYGQLGSLILHGEAIIVPLGERKYQGHLGMSKYQYRVRQCIYWPGINKDIGQQVKACPIYQRH